MIEDIALARVVRRYRALQLSNPCQRRYWLMRSYHAKLAEVRLFQRVREILG